MFYVAVVRFTYIKTNIWQCDVVHSPLKYIFDKQTTKKGLQSLWTCCIWVEFNQSPPWEKLTASISESNSEAKYKIRSSHESVSLWILKQGDTET